MIEYGSIWQAKEPPFHEVCAFMTYNYYDVPKVFTMEVGGNGRSKLLSETFIKQHYTLKEKK